MSQTKLQPIADVVPGEHVVGRFIGDEAGPTLVVFGSLHGNEAAGLIALRKAAVKLAGAESELAGRVYLLAGNTRAVARGERFLHSDLNRYWTQENIRDNSAPRTRGPDGAEDDEQAELLALIGEIFPTAKGEVYTLDLHSTSAEGVPFATVGDTLRNRSFAQQFPVTILLGIEEQLDGTLLEYLNNLGAVTLGFEAGQHYADSTVENHEALVYAALAVTGIANIVPERDPFSTLERSTGVPRIYEVRYRHAISEADEFQMNAGFENFDPVKKGQVLAVDKNGPIRAVESGLILMPLYQKLGDDGFFLGREVAGFWICLSGILRRMKVGNLMPLLPGVSRSTTDPDVFEIDTRIARFFPLQIFHLLGFRKRRKVGKKLIVSRRKFDTVSPFARR